MNGFNYLPQQGSKEADGGWEGEDEGLWVVGY